MGAAVAVRGVQAQVCDSHPCAGVCLEDLWTALLSGTHGTCRVAALWDKAGRISVTAAQWELLDPPV